MAEEVKRKFNWWELIGTAGGAAVGAGIGLLVGAPVQGALIGARLGQEISPGGWWIEELPARPPLGAEGKRAAKEQARAMQSILNAQMAQTIIPTINREWASAGRYASGQRLAAIGRATAGAQAQLARQVSLTELQRYLADLQATIDRERMAEEREYRQAVMAQQGTSMMDIAQLLTLLYLQNPELLAFFRGGTATAPQGSASLTDIWEQERRRRYY